MNPSGAKDYLHGVVVGKAKEEARCPPVIRSRSICPDKVFHIHAEPGATRIFN